MRILSFLRRDIDPHEGCRREYEALFNRYAAETQVKVVYFDPGPGQVMEPLQVLDAYPSEGGLVIRVAPYGLMPADRRIKAPSVKKRARRR